MQNSRHRRIAVAVAVAVLLVAAYFCWPARNAGARSRIQEILLSKATEQEMLDQLGPYVKVGERWNDVRRRIVANPNSPSKIERPTIMGVLLQGRANLMLCIQKDGTICAIGRHPYGEQTTWLTEQNW
jgi:hypothetical protein